MKQIALAYFPWPWLTALGLLIFFSFFVALVWYVNRRSTQPLYNAASHLPLEEGERYE